MNRTLGDRPTTKRTVPEPAPQNEGPAAPEVLIKEARRRQRRRWLVVALIVAAAGLTARLVSSIGPPPPRPPAPAHKEKPPAAQPGGRASTKPAPAAAATAPPRLVTIAFFDATSGYGVFTTGTTSACNVEVAKTTDGGATFDGVVDVAPCSTLGYQPGLAFDDHGDGFLYSPSSDVLYATHDGGSSWSASDQKGKVVSVEALGYSVWILLAACPPTRGPTQPAASVCQLVVDQSTDGGTTWRPSAAPLVTAPPFTGDSAGSGRLVRLSQSDAYVLGSPTSPTVPPGVTSFQPPPSTVPLWHTSNGGQTWSPLDVPCGVGIPPQGTALDLSAAPTGTLFAICGSEPGAGNQLKSVVVSTDGGLTWHQPGTCLRGAPGWCGAQGLTGGYVGEVEALSRTMALLALPRDGLEVTTDGGATWHHVGSYVTRVADITFFNDAVGVVLGNSPSVEPDIWHTSNGGATWTLVTPVIR